MTTCRSNIKALFLWTALFYAPFTLAESNPMAGASGLGKLDSGSVESGFSMPQSPTFVPGAPPAPTQDRMKSQVAAKAMGMAAAAQQKIACFNMMNESMKEENKKNQGLMMAMAQQMCAQADQSMASAMKNDEGIKQVSAADIPKMAEMKIAPVTLGKDKIKEAEIPTITFNDEATKGSGLVEFPTAAPAVAAAKPEAGEQVFNKPSTTDDLKDPVTQFTQRSKLDAINRNPASVPSEGEKGIAGSQPGLGFGGGGVAGLPAKGGSGGNDAPTISDSESLASSRKRGGVITAGTGGEGGGAAEKSGSGFDLSALMEQMMGGPAAGEGGGGLEVITLNTQAPEEKPPNLFEYASFRYHQLSTEKGAIRRRKNQGIKVPHRGATLAQVSKIETEGDQKIDTLKHAGQ